MKSVRIVAPCLWQHTHTAAQLVSSELVSTFSAFCLFVIFFKKQFCNTVVQLGENLWYSKIFWLEIQDGYIHCEIWAVYRQNIRSALVVCNL